MLYFNIIKCKLKKFNYRRNGFPIEFGLALWEEYMLSAMESTFGLRRVLISFGNLLSDPIGETNVLFKKLKDFGIEKICCPSNEEIAEFVDPNLNRSKSNSKKDVSELSPQDIIFQAFEDKSALNWNEQTIPKLNENSRKILSQEQKNLCV